MNDPIISPWFIYLITRIDNIKCFLSLFPLMFLFSALLIAFMKTIAGDFEDYEEGKERASRYVRNVIKVGLITIPLTIILNLLCSRFCSCSLLLYIWIAIVPDLKLEILSFPVNLIGISK